MSFSLKDNENPVHCSSFFVSVRLLIKTELTHIPNEQSLRDEINIRLTSIMHSVLQCFCILVCFIAKGNGFRCLVRTELALVDSSRMACWQILKRLYVNSKFRDHKVLKDSQVFHLGIILPFLHFTTSTVYYPWNVLQYPVQKRHEVRSLTPFTEESILRVCPSYHQVTLDVNRLDSLMPPDADDGQKDATRRDMMRLVVSVLLDNPTAHYYQVRSC